ncbi:MAG: NAD(P)H-dependent oxidoreductase [Clostridiales bacterium]|nr:NAD(P)H-dependent oxidoreductase [Clostridiales bacterium]
MNNKTIGVFVGSLRKASFSRAIANFVSSLAPENFKMNIIDLADLPMYNQDLDDEGRPPESWTKFRTKIKPLDGCLFVTPEYNRSVPAVLKNALDVGSRPYGQNAWSGKAGGIISVSPGSLGAFGANHHLRQSMVFLNILLLQQPEAYIRNVSSILNEKGDVVNESMKKFLQQYMDSFVKWVNTISSMQ